MLPAAVTTEAPTACGGGGTPAPAAVRPRRETTGSGYLPCPSPRKPRPSRSQRHVRQRQHLLIPPLSKQLEPLKQCRLIQVQLHCLQQQQFLSRHPRAARHSPWCRTLHTGPTGTPSASPAAGTQRDSSGHFRPAGTFLIHCAPRPLNYLLPSASAERHKNHSGVTFSLC